ncbi:UDP-glucose 4-epimerase [Halteromyces radiatus]|uniref:UDP-glucose 4-epimerase n=1 Tax=Halteromyces radiatus TaxID=101107 RepID=UPI00221E6DB3|nr:UDP-glucose 4-epimerase [Halteromyces radiatus]KAI8086435.1 UDP-glucose 4-epimerase [Halteromyces radiatus]
MKVMRNNGSSIATEIDQIDHFGSRKRKHRRSLTPLPSPSLLNTKRRHSQQHLLSTPYTKKHVLVTGGAGYIGSHTVLELLNANYSIVVMDNLVNANLEALARVEYLSGKSIYFVEGDVTCEKDLEKVFEAFPFWAVVHFAAIKAVGESTQIPLTYYHNNVTGSLLLFRMMDRFKVKNLVFSSSATVYGEPEMMPVNETASLGPVTNPYGRTKLFVEEMLRDVCDSDPDWNVCLLRFFNPVGAHPSGLMGECPQGIPNNLLPYVIRVLQGHLPCVQVFGSDYDTVDGTGVRDYIHVCDLATGHVAALKKLEEESTTNLSSPSSPSPSSFTTKPILKQEVRRGKCVAYNLGTGAGYSVLEIIYAMEKATQKKIPYKIVERRPGDVGVCTADATLANKELGWKPLYTMDDMCQDMWRWTRRNPNGYDGPLVDDDEL